MKKAIVLMGNLGAGKSTIGKMLENVGWTRVVIDDFRASKELFVRTQTTAKKGADFQNEYLARNAMLKAIHDAKGNVVYETTTANKVHAKAMKALEVNGYEIKRVKLLIDKETSFKRHTGLNPWNRDHEQGFEYIEEFLKKEWADEVYDTVGLECEKIFKYIC